MYIKYTHVDVITRAPVTTAPAFNGPDFPAINGLEFLLALESKYPTDVPIFYGTCPDNTDINIPGVFGQVSEEEYQAAYDQEMQDRFTRAKKETTHNVTLIRNSKEAGGFLYMGKKIDSDPLSVLRINTTVQAAQVAVAAGQPFSVDWTCADNTSLTLDAAGVAGLPVALATYANALHQHSRQLKAQIDATTTIEELRAIDLQVGWPE